MGCGPSSPDGKPVVVNAHASPNRASREKEHRQNGHVTSLITLHTANHNGRGDVEGTWEKVNAETQKQKTSRQINGHQAVPKLEPQGTKSVTFEVNLDSNCNNVVHDSKKIPNHLKSKLTPLVNAPKLTAKMLVERQRNVEVNRLKELEKIKETSRHSSRVRKNIRQARQFEEEQIKNHEIVKLEEKQFSAGKNRETQIAMQNEKRQIREERARQVKLRAQQKRLEEEAGILGFELEKDGEFNDDADSWLGDDDELTQFHSDLGERLFSASALSRQASDTERITTGTARVTSGTERVYSGRESPMKRFQPRDSADRRSRLSASTADSFDYAFQRAPPSGKSNTHTQPVEDDFFDT